MIWDIVKKEVISSLQFTYHVASTPVFVPSGLSVLPPINVIFTSCCWTAHLISVANNQYVFFLPLGWSEVRFNLVRLQIGIGLDRLLTKKSERSEECTLLQMLLSQDICSSFKDKIFSFVSPPSSPNSLPSSRVPRPSSSNKVSRYPCLSFPRKSRGIWL